MKIEIENLSFSYEKQTQVLRNVTVNLPPGITGIIGGNGAGKSTFLQLLTGHLARPSDARIAFSPDKEPQKAVYLPENIELPAFLTPHEILSAIPPVDAQESIFKALRISEFDQKRIRSCSLGMKKRFVLAMSLSSNSDLIVLDEPFNGIDVDTLLLIQNLLKKIIFQNPNRIFLIASHQLDFLEHVCSNVLVLQLGEVLFFGPPSRLLESTRQPNLLGAYHQLTMTQQNP